MFGKILKWIDDYRGIIRADLFVSVGENCKSAYNLDKCHLRTFSSPFDWMRNYKLEHIIYFLRNDGKDFFAKIEKNDKYEIKDTNTNMISIHDFPYDKSVEEYYPKFVDKYKRRFANLKKAISNSNRIVFVSVNREDSKIQEFQTFLDEMQKIHKAQYIFINVRHNENLATMTRSVVNMGGGGNIIIEYSFNDTHPKGGNSELNPDAWMGNTKKWRKMLGQFGLPTKVEFINFLVRNRDKYKRSLAKRKNTILSILRLR